MKAQARLDAEAEAQAIQDEERRQLNERQTEEDEELAAGAHAEDNPSSEVQTAAPVSEPPSSRRSMAEEPQSAPAEKAQRYQDVRPKPVHVDNALRQSASSTTKVSMKTFAASDGRNHQQHQKRPVSSAAAAALPSRVEHRQAPLSSSIPYKTPPAPESMYKSSRTASNYPGRVVAPVTFSHQKSYWNAPPNVFRSNASSSSSSSGKYPQLSVTDTQVPFKWSSTKTKGASSHKSTPSSSGPSNDHPNATGENTGGNNNDVPPASKSAETPRADEPEESTDQRKARETRELEKLKRSIRILCNELSLPIPFGDHETKTELIRMREELEQEKRNRDSEATLSTVVNGIAMVAENVIETWRPLGCRALGLKQRISTNPKIARSLKKLTQNYEIPFLTDATPHVGIVIDFAKDLMESHVQGSEEEQAKKASDGTAFTGTKGEEDSAGPSASPKAGSKGARKKAEDERPEDVEILYKLMVEQQKSQQEQLKREAKFREEQQQRDAKFQEQQLQMQLQTQQMMQQMMAFTQQQQQLNPSALLSLISAIQQNSTQKPNDIPEQVQISGDLKQPLNTPLISKPETISDATSSALPLSRIPDCDIEEAYEDDEEFVEPTTNNYVDTVTADDDETAAFFATGDASDEDEEAELTTAEKARMAARVKFIRSN